MSRCLWLLGLLGFLFCGTVQAADMKVAPVKSQDQQVADTMGQLGFKVKSVQRMGDGVWEVRVDGFDGSRASGAFRGAIVAPAANIGGASRSKAVHDGVTAGRGGALGPRGTSAKSDQDGSATGGGTGGGTEGSSGGGRDGGPLPGSDNNEGGSATGGGHDGGPDQGTNPRGQASTLRVSVAADGKMVVDKASLRQAGFVNSVGVTSNGRVTFR